MDNAKQFIQRYCLKGWLSAWLTATTDNAKLAKIDQSLLRAMNGYFQVRELCIARFARPPKLSVALVDDYKIRPPRTITACSTFKELNLCESHAPCTEHLTVCDVARLPLLMYRKPPQPAGRCLQHAIKSIPTQMSFTWPQTTLMVEMVERARKQPAPAAAAAASQPDPLEAFVEAHGGDKRVVLADPALHVQLVALFGVESSVLLEEMTSIGMDVKTLMAKLDQQRKVVDRIAQTADATLQGVGRIERGVEQLLVSTNPYAFLPLSLAPKLRQFWIDSFGTQQPFTIWAHHFSRCIRSF